MSAFTLRVNGELHTVDVSPDTPLLWVLRDSLGLTGTKFSCGEGRCGACTVHLDGEAVKSCRIEISKVGEREVVTIEGLSADGSHPLQQSWIEDRVAQCGYCQPGQIMAAAALLAKTPQPTDEEIDAAMADVLCRCGTYQRIRQAIHHAAGMEASS